MDTLEQKIEKAEGRLPAGWSLKIEVKNGWCGVTAIRPDGTEADMDDGEQCLSEQVAAVMALARDEIEAAAMSSNRLDMPMPAALSGLAKAIDVGAAGIGSSAWLGHVNSWLETWSHHRGAPRAVFEGQFRATLCEIFDEIERRAESNMLKTGKLEGMHYAALKEVRRELCVTRSNEQRSATRPDGAGGAQGKDTK